MASAGFVLVAGALADAPAAWLQAHARVHVAAGGDPRFRSLLEQAEGLVVHTDTMVDPSLLQHAPRLRVVGRAGVGLDTVDVAACRARGVQVVYAPGSNTQAVVEYVLGLLLEALRPRLRLERPVDAEQWRRARAAHVGRVQIDELTIGILGLGRIGGRLARVLAALGAALLYHDLRDIAPDDRAAAQPVSAEQLFERSDVVSVHVDGRGSNRGLIGERLLSRLPARAIFINTSRGFVVDNQALARFLRAHPAALALLDVHEPEPFDAAYPLLGLPNAWLLPHLAGRTRTGIEQMAWVVRDVVAVLEGRPPRHPAPPHGA